MDGKWKADSPGGLAWRWLSTMMQSKQLPMNSKRKVLMILTHDRLDCLRLCLEMLERAGAYACFDKVVLC